MTEPRICAYPPCSGSFEGRENARYCSDACRTAAWKERTGYADQRARKPSRNGSGRRQGGVTHAHGRVVGLVERLVGDRHKAEALVREIASPRQRARLLERGRS